MLRKNLWETAITCPFVSLVHSFWRYHLIGFEWRPHPFQMECFKTDTPIWARSSVCPMFKLKVEPDSGSFLFQLEIFKHLKNLWGTFCFWVFLHWFFWIQEVFWFHPLGPGSRVQSLGSCQTEQTKQTVKLMMARSGCH